MVSAKDRIASALTLAVYILSLAKGGSISETAFGEHYWASLQRSNEKEEEGRKSNKIENLKKTASEKGAAY